MALPEGTRDEWGRIVTGPDGKIAVWLFDGSVIRQYPIDAMESVQEGRGSIEPPDAPIEEEPAVEEAAQVVATPARRRARREGQAGARGGEDSRA